MNTIFEILSRLVNCLSLFKFVRSVELKPILIIDWSINNIYKYFNTLNLYHIYIFFRYNFYVNIWSEKNVIRKKKKLCPPWMRSLQHPDHQIPGLPVDVGLALPHKGVLLPLSHPHLDLELEGALFVHQAEEWKESYCRVCLSNSYL